MDAIDLITFDDASPHSPDPSVWRANLDALRAEQPEFARHLADTTLPSHWRAVQALDSFPTYRIEQPGEAPRWLTATTAPATRAAALLATSQPVSGNCALPMIAAGAELSILLDRLSHQQAVFVFEQDLTQLAAVLRTVNVAPAVAAGRCIIVPTGNEQGLLEQLLERHPGLLPPTSIVAPMLCDPERLTQVRKTCDAAAQHINQARARRLEALASRTQAAAPSRDAQPRLAVLALGPSVNAHRLAAQLTAAADQLGWSTCQRTASGPRNIHALPHFEALADFGAELTMCVAHPPGTLPLPPGKPVCQWHLQTRDVPATLPDDNTVHLAASPHVASALQAAGVSSGRLIDFHWAWPFTHTESPSSRAAEHDQPPSSKRVVIVGDLPDASAAACGIEQPTHKLLWKQLHETASKVWDSSKIAQPATLLRSAERSSRVNLGERSLQQRMVRIIEYVLIPAVVLETILRLLIRDSFEVLTVGKGWQRCSNATVKPLAETTDDLPSALMEAPVSAAIFAGPLDPLSPALFHAVARGWPLLIHSPGGASLTAQLGGILHPQQHYQPFAGAKDLRVALSAIQSDPSSVQPRCSRAREHLQAQHTYRHRLAALAGQLGLEWPGIES